jgi:F0F1-type ATP synthase assembly protein I
MKKRPNSRRLAGVGFELAGAVAGFVLFGYWIGKYYGHAEMGIVIGAVLGLIGGMYNLIRVTLAVSKEAANQKRSSDSDEDG